MGDNFLFAFQIHHYHKLFTIIINYSFLIKPIFIKRLLCFKHFPRHRGCNDELSKAPALMGLMFLLGKINKHTHTYICTHAHTHTLLWGNSCHEGNWFQRV